MKNSKVMLVLVALVLASSLVSAFWPFTGNAVNLPSRTFNCLSSVVTDDTTGVNTSEAIQYSYSSTFGRTYTGAVAVSYCSKDNKTLNEYLCAGDSAKTAKVKCDQGCINQSADVPWSDDNVMSAICYAPSGSQPSSIQPVCTDSDEGINASVSGVVFGTDTRGSYFATDSCIGTNKIKEMGCSDANESTAIILKCKDNCTNSTVTLSGTVYHIASCNADFSQCSRNDSKGITIVINSVGKKTVAKDICLSKNIVIQNICNGVNISYQNVTCPAGDVCKKGACVSANSNLLCSDSDGGKYFNVQGTVTRYAADGSVLGTATDMCLSDKNLLEFGCQRSKGDSTLVGNSTRYSGFGVKIKNCKNGCSSGACK